MDVDRACQSCSSFNQPIFHEVYPSPCYDFSPSWQLGVETRAQRMRREEVERLTRNREQKYGYNFAKYCVSDIDNIRCITFLTAWLFAIPTSPIVNKTDTRYNEILAQKLLYRMNSLNANG